MGTDKLFMQVEGRPLLERVIGVCKECFKTVKLVAPSSTRLQSFGYPVVNDNPRARGPMAGVMAALTDCRGDCCFVTAADLCDLSPDIVASLIDRYEKQHYLGVREAKGIQPLCGIYHVCTLDVFYLFAQRGEYSMKKLVQALMHDGLDLPEGRWRNINCPDDLIDGECHG
jgi:molybdopterin-guanine dinucleotide biosynthesis protein A